MTVANNKVVEIHYVLKDRDGELIDSSEGQTPLAYIHGIGNIIPGLEKELEGKNIGDKVKAVIPPAQGYGEYEEKMVHKIPKENFKDQSQIKIEAQFRVEMEDGPRIATITQIEENDVTVDMNHPLAGEELHFDVEVMAVRDATDEELSHGHVHDGHHPH
jgi:FKBP-type peptidyl-prolyl cis-trans isomerase SlyD